MERDKPATIDFPANRAKWSRTESDRLIARVDGCLIGEALQTPHGWYYKSRGGDIKDKKKIGPFEKFEELMRSVEEL